MTWIDGALPDADRRAIEDLIVEHAWLLDHGRWHDVAQLYVDDGTLTLGAHTLVGRDQFHKWADTRAANSARQTHHQCTNIRLRPDEEGASGTVMLVLHVSDSGQSPYVDFIGEYRDRYARDNHGHWRFGARVLHPLAAAADQQQSATGTNNA
ncbi:hypothetical protein AWC29_05265 [Mycobacterium triplex]|uniref:SnoaL-like domain-containing protein n=1 Tax=Mycobacterium triplex TaxID=47839 RepID=A0A024K7P7_9MYCO|nr:MULTISPECIES: nuclear transport factor 2 family protein [Mycobacterium simiae complex]ORX07588.1 hypothetical protein AWC29_05265 [Mycobacterium triplex]CDO91587.1 hypothetical protein BN973_05996 [Mycobacterium triplex]